MIIGTAGHVNHGKTTLVRALTGVDCDALEEEKRRGITIRLGFARWALPGGHAVSVVDVPGHARLAHTMATGALGLDVALLVIAADEGVMPQTREHLHACHVLGVRHAVVALTRIDRIHDVPQAAARVREDLAGSFARDAAIVPVCAPDGTGLAALGEAVEALLERVPARCAHGPLLLPVDRAFTLRGFGTVVTGSLLRGRLAAGESVTLFPARRSVRVRALHVHGAQQSSVEPGHRVGVNLAAIKPQEIARGSFLSRAGEVCVGSVFDAELHWLAHMPEPLVSARSLGYVCGAARARARLHADGAIAPGTTSTARVVLDRAVPLTGGLHFVLRGPGDAVHGAVVGGGRIVDAAPPRRRKAAVRVALAAGEPIEALLDEAGRRGVDPSALAARLGFAPTSDSERLFSTAVLSRARAQALAAVDAWHRDKPDEAGMPEAQLKLGPVGSRAITALVQKGELVREGALLRRPQHDARPEQQQRHALSEAIYAHIEGAGLQAPNEQDIFAAFEQSQAKLREALRELERDKRVLRCEGFCFAASAVQPLMRALAHEVLARGQLPVSWLKDHAQLSRKHAIPLWTLMDRQGVTQRKGNMRVPGPRARALLDAE